MKVPVNPSSDFLLIGKADKPVGWNLESAPLFTCFCLSYRFIKKKSLYESDKEDYVCSVNPFEPSTVNRERNWIMGKQYSLLKISWIMKAQWCTCRVAWNSLLCSVLEWLWIISWFHSHHRCHYHFRRYCNSLITYGAKDCTHWLTQIIFSGSHTSIPACLG